MQQVHPWHERSLLSKHAMQLPQPASQRIASAPSQLTFSAQRDIVLTQ